MDTRQRQQILSSGSDPLILPAGYLVFSEARNLRLVQFDPQTEEVTGPIYPVLDGVHTVTSVGLEDAAFGLSKFGDLVFVSGGLGAASFDTSLVWVDREGRETAIDAESAHYIAPQVSLDGRRIASIRMEGILGVGEIWILNADGTQAFPLAAEGADYNPVWTPDGESVTYTSDGNIFEKRVDQDDARLQLMSRSNYQLPRSWSPDGEFLAFTELSLSGQRIWVMSRDGEPEPFLPASFNSMSPRFAPSGSWIAYTADESGHSEVYVRRFPGEARGIQVSRGGGRGPDWSRDGRELFYRRGTAMMAVVTTLEPELQLAQPVELWARRYFTQVTFPTNYDVAPDGRFLMLQLPDMSDVEPARINVVLDWLSEVEAQIQSSN